ncbi:MAG: hypothetical protein AB7Q45_25585 [Planctomycetaceae bacterium]
MFPMLRQPHIIALLAFNAAYLLASTVVAVRAGNGEFAFYLVVMLLLGAAVLIVHRRVNLSLDVLWGLSLWGLAHMAGGLVPVPAEWPINGDIRVLYSLWLVPDLLKYDHVVHAYGFGVTTWLCWEGLRRILADRQDEPVASVRPTPGMLVLAAAAGMGFGAMNEVVEFIATLTMPETNVGGYNNTGWDLVSNLTGCILAAILIRFRAA